MPTGNPQSTLLSELNRLANGGTYPPVNTMDEAAAARAWAAAENVTLTVTDTVGVLNEIAGLPRDQWLDYSGVCNYIAGTSDLPAAAALRQVTGAPPPPPPGYSWTVPFNNNMWYVSESFSSIDLYGMNALSQPGWPQTSTEVTFTISGITGPNAALNGVPLVALATEYALDSDNYFGPEFQSAYEALGIPGYIGDPQNYFPGFTLNWQ